MSRKAYRRREERRPRRRSAPDNSLAGGSIPVYIQDTAPSDLDLRLYPSGVLSPHFPLQGDHREPE